MTEFWATEYREQRIKQAGLGTSLAMRFIAPSIASAARGLVPQKFYSNKFRTGMGVGLSGVDNTMGTRRSWQAGTSPMLTGMVDHEVGQAMGSYLRSRPELKYYAQQLRDNPGAMAALYTNKVPGMTRGQAKDLRSSVEQGFGTGTNIPRFIHEAQNKPPLSRIGRTLQDVVKNPAPIPIPTSGRVGSGQQRGMSVIPSMVAGAALDPFAPLTGAAVHAVSNIPVEAGVAAANRGASGTILRFKHGLVAAGMSDAPVSKLERAKRIGMHLYDPASTDFRNLGRDFKGVLRDSGGGPETLKVLKQQQQPMESFKVPIATDLEKISPALAKMYRARTLAKALKGNPNFA